MLLNSKRQQQKARYRKNHLKTISFECNINTDADILEHLSKQPNKSGYIKQTLRKAMERKNSCDNN